MPTAGDPSPSTITGSERGREAIQVFSTEVSSLWSLLLSQAFRRVPASEGTSCQPTRWLKVLMEVVAAFSRQEQENQAKPPPRGWGKEDDRCFRGSFSGFITPLLRVNHKHKQPS